MMVQAMKNTNLIKVLLPIVIILVIAFGVLTLIKEKTTPPLNTGTFQARVGATIPDAELSVLGGGTKPLSSFKSKILLINFWASWCDSCITEMPSLVQLRSQFKPDEFEIAFINVDEKPEAVVPSLLKKFKIDFPSFLDTEQKLSDLFDVRAIPFTMMIDRNRKILLIETGERNWNGKDIQQLIAKWLKE